MECDTGKPWEDDPILPKDVYPTNYTLTIFPLLENGTFSGDISINLTLTKPRKYIVLHQHDLNITKTILKTKNGDNIKVSEAFPYVKNEFWVVLPEKELESGEYILDLVFDGSLLKKIVGFYRSTYKSKDGNSRYLATTKFEPTYARKAFPCFDEPSLKATFSIRVVTPMEGGYFALSNMDLESEKRNFPQDGFVTNFFNPTPPMATYLACFIVCDFEVLEAGNSSNGTPIKLYARTGHVDNTKHAGQIAVQVLDYFSKYFDMGYPLPKLDLIAIPDFVSGAMENWGLITFRETALLAGNDTTTRGLISISGTVSHELAHMWFGDIVTMEWWDDLWLNEGFATFLANRAVEHLHPEMNAEALFVANTLQSVLEDDSTLSSHPIIQQVQHPDQITEMFDSISYFKGSSVLRMIEDYDKEGFRTGVSNYLKKHKWKNARTQDLWQFLSNEYKSVKDLPHILDTWTKQEGYPLITVEKEGNNIKISQSRYLSDFSAEFDKNKSAFGYKWDVPIKYITSGEPKTLQSAFLLSDEPHSTIKFPEGTSWFKLNSRQVGFYRVNYTAEQWMNFTQLLTDDIKTISLPEDRSNLIDDAFSLASAGYLEYNVPLQLISYLQSNKETHFLPWLTSSSHILRLRKILYGTPVFEKFKRYVHRILEHVVSDSLWEIKESSPIFEKILKSTLANFAVRMEVPAAKEKVNELFNNWISGKSDIPSVDFKSTVFTYGMGGEQLESNWNQMWSLYLKEHDPQQKVRLMEALSSVTDPHIIKKLLELAKNEDLVRSQDYFSVLFHLALIPEGNSIVWDFVRTNWEYLVKRFTLNDRTFGKLLPVTATLFYTEEKLAQLEAFMAKYPEAGAGTAGRKRALEQVKLNIKWHKTYLPKLDGYLDALIF
ncbi:glutamyl aminopeptidase-like isoform X2 [Rhodnius prolixus]|uniref:Aminopeptidase n=1 Tax=Rhodnius prolixus TaxID=13249 RepID=A0ABL0DQ75_RHOPR